jgi:hypothetical protein
LAVKTTAIKVRRWKKQKFTTIKLRKNEFDIEAYNKVSDDYITITKKHVLVQLLHYSWWWFNPDDGVKIRDCNYFVIMVSDKIRTQ